MKQTTKYVALDVQLATTVTTVREQSGRVIARGILPTDAGPLVEFFGGMRGSVTLTVRRQARADRAESQIEPWFASCDRARFIRVQRIGAHTRRTMRKKAAASR